MPTYRRCRAGRLAKQVGAHWEMILDARSRQSGVTCVRIPDGCKQVRGRSGYQLARIRTPFDYVLLYQKLAIVLDAKTKDSSTYTYSDLIPHQIHSLHQCSRDAYRAGYLVWHRESDEVVFYDIHTLMKLRRGQSVSADDGHSLGSSGSINLARLFTVPLPSSLDSSHISADIL